MPNFLNTRNGWTEELYIDDDKERGVVAAAVAFVALQDELDALREELDKLNDDETKYSSNIYIAEYLEAQHDHHVECLGKAVVAWEWLLEPGKTVERLDAIFKTSIEDEDLDDLDCDGPKGPDALKTLRRVSTSSDLEIVMRQVLAYGMGVLKERQIDAVDGPATRAAVDETREIFRSMPEIYDLEYGTKSENVKKVQRFFSHIKCPGIRVTGKYDPATQRLLEEKIAKTVCDERISALYDNRDGD